MKIGYSDKVEISLCEVEVYGSIYYLYIFFYIILHLYD